MASYICTSFASPSLPVSTESRLPEVHTSLEERHVGRASTIDSACFHVSPSTACLQMKVRLTWNIGDQSVNGPPVESEAHH